ncbi:MAG: uracil-DNA glycosylase [Variibacter sp.]|nr:uracil-DNA glycosylase [Variibacter sp.]
MTAENTKAARDLLAFYAEAGVHTLVGDAPVNRLAEAASPPAGMSPPPEVEAPSAASTAGSRPLLPLPPAQVASAAPPAGLLAPDAAVMAAREAARTAGSLEELRVILAGFEGCALKGMAKQLVFSDGNPQARLMFVGEAPGREEDLEGLPFVGRSGQLLDRMLKAIGLDRTAAYIANIVPWRPPGNRTPTPQESAICLPFIQRQIELANPDVLVCLGGPSAQTLLGIREGIMRARGRWLAYHTGTRDIRARATLHPAYLLRQPLAKRLAWRDMLAIKRALEGRD